MRHEDTRPGPVIMRHEDTRPGPVIMRHGDQRGRCVRVAVCPPPQASGDESHKGIAMSDRCPKCGSGLTPMRGSMAGKGWNCSQGRWDFKTRSVIGCDGKVWNRGSFTRKEKTPRPACWLSIEKPTDEQNELRRLLSLAPSARGGRLLIVDAVAGSAKTSSMAWVSEAIQKRVGAAEILNWSTVAFNTNAADGLSAKIPEAWPNIGTINSTGGRWQGYSFRNYKSAKVRNIFKELIEPLPKKERPRMGPLSAFCERGRDMLVYSDDTGDSGFWLEAVSRLACRFPGLAKRLEKETAAEVVAQYFPDCMVRSLADSKVIDLTEQYARPALAAIRKTGWRLPWHLLDRNAEWTDADIAHLATLIRAVDIPSAAGVIVDESQDLSLSQIVLFIAATYKRGELVLVGDDCHGTPGDADYKAGQGIFRWRGAGGGVLSLIPRLWKELTGERAVRASLSITFRVPPEGCAYVSAFCPRMRSNKPAGSGEVLTGLSAVDAFQRWLDLPEGQRALWLTRRNAPLGPIFMETIRARKRCCLRGGGDFSAKVDLAISDGLTRAGCSPWYDDAGEYRASLAELIPALQEEASEDGAAGGDDSMGGFLLSIAQEIQRDPAILTEAYAVNSDGTHGGALEAEATIGNLRRFVSYFAGLNAERVCSTVYRAKGDEADLVIVDDCESINTAWNGDAQERNAIAFVACTRQKSALLVCGEVAGPMGDEEATPAPSAAAIAETEAPEVAPVVAPLPVKVRKPRKVKATQPGLFD